MKKRIKDNWSITGDDIRNPSEAEMAMLDAIDKDVIPKMKEDMEESFNKSQSSSQARIRPSHG